jgi:hypothetical protein
MGGARDAVEEHARGRGGEQSGNPIPEPMGEAPSLQKIEDILPTHGVESLSNVKLEVYTFFGIFVPL